jgi:hypothetical protein
MDPLITNGIDPALLQVLEKRGQERDPVLRRKRPVVTEEVPEEVIEETAEEEGDPPKHTLDDLA